MRLMTTETAARMLAKGATDEIELAYIGPGMYPTGSAKTPAGVRYHTTENNCSCPRFTGHGYCKHLAHVQAAEAKKRASTCEPPAAGAPALSPIIDEILDHLGITPPTQAPDTCPYCNGDGRRDYQDEVRPGVWQWTSDPCTICQPDANYMGWWR